MGNSVSNTGGGIIVGPTYRVQGKVPFKDLVEMDFAPGTSANSVSGEKPKDLMYGTPSLFNPYALVVFPTVDGTAFNSGGDFQNKIIDGGANDGVPGVAGNLFSPIAQKSVPTISQLVEDDKLAKKTPYYYTDFLYCKYVGRIPINQLITLRRYPAPTYDNLAVPAYDKNLPSMGEQKKTTDTTTSIPPDVSTQEEFFPIAQAVTWFGEETGNKLSDILSFGVKMNWKMVEAEVNVIAGNEQGNEDVGNGAMAGAGKWLGILTGNVNSPWATQNSQYDPYNGGPYSHRVYGPVNVISKTYKRDRGLEFNQTLNINFEYSLKSIGNINPKAAMLDLMSNMLALTYNNAAFWGGANRYFPQRPTYPFLGGRDGMAAWYRGEPTNFTKAVGSYVSSAFDGLSKILGELAEDPIATLKKIASGAVKLGMTELGKGRAPSIVMMKSLLTGEPVGEWHMVIGNPYDPIAAIGNLVCTEAKFQFNDIIGADNFPTEMKVTITVENGRPRDAGDIQSIFNKGQGRIYYPPKNAMDYLNSSSSTRNSRNDTSWKKGKGTGNDAGLYSKHTKAIGLFTGSESEFDSLIGSTKNMTTESGSAAQARRSADLMFLRTGSFETNK